MYILIISHSNIQLFHSLSRPVRPRPRPRQFCYTKVYSSPSQTAPAISSIQKTGCSLTDYACICKNAAFVSELTGTIQKECKPDEIQSKFPSRASPPFSYIPAFSFLWSSLLPSRIVGPRNTFPYPVPGRKP